METFRASGWGRPWKRMEQLFILPAASRSGIARRSVRCSNVSRHGRGASGTGGRAFLQYTHHRAEQAEVEVGMQLSHYCLPFSGRPKGERAKRAVHLTAAIE